MGAGLGREEKEAERLYQLQLRESLPKKKDVREVYRIQSAKLET